MTLIVAVLCSDGAVIAADRQITHGSLGRQTIGQPGTKVEILDNNVLFALTGYTGLGQEFQDTIADHSSQFEQRKYAKIRELLKGKLITVVERAFATAMAAAPVIGQSAASMEAVCGAIFAAEFKDGLGVVEITPQANFDKLTDSNPFVCLGSGRQNADPFIAFLRSIYWPDRLPTVDEAITSTYWTIHFVSELGTSGVGLGVNVIVLEKEEDSFVTREVNDEKFLETNEFIEAARTTLAALPKGGITEPPDAASSAADEIPTLDDSQ